MPWPVAKALHQGADTLLIHKTVYGKQRWQQATRICGFFPPPLEILRLPNSLPRYTHSPFQHRSLSTSLIVSVYSHNSTGNSLQGAPPRGEANWRQIWSRDTGCSCGGNQQLLAEQNPRILSGTWVLLDTCRYISPITEQQSCLTD